MPTRRHLKRDQAGVLTAEQGDENIEHLSTVQTISGNTQLFTGGRYFQPNGNLTHTLPTSNEATFSITVSAGSATLVGVVEGVTNPVYGPGGERRFARVSGEWRNITPTAENLDVIDDFVSRTTGGSIVSKFTWMLNNVPVTVELPATVTDGDSRIIVRGEELVTVTVAGGGTLVGVDPATGELVRSLSARINEPHARVEFVYLSGDWRVGSKA